ncbi:Gdt1-like protein 1 protein [Thalictrum thalictroides]|uniref:Dirigent protein n=2 Tax=Thalictrum thalictroides TaxID=46969 RepID=A0A7J6X771_THATH|nr:Gdt1-like protein 1 protein [Thalictrum thalictroides]
MASRTTTTTTLLSIFLLFLCLSGSSAFPSRWNKNKYQPCKRLVLYFHDIIYNGKNAKNATSAIIGEPAGADKIILAGQSHFGNLVAFDDPITLDNNLHSQPVGRAQGFYLYDRKDIFTAWVAFTFVLNTTNLQGTINFAGADPLMEKTRDISVIGGTGDFFMARGVATLMTDAFEGEVYFRLQVDIKLYECCWLKFPMLVGLLTLLDSQQALAGSEFATGFQSLPYLGDLGDISTGFASAFLLIFFSELGDKTFFIAALLAARNSGPVIFIGTFGALATMTVISVVLGRTFHYVDDILPFRFGETDLPLDDIAAVCLLLYFGVSTLIEAASSDGQKTEEEQKEAELAVSDFTGNGAGLLAAANTVFSTFLVVFVAEWGDKSFFSTIALAAASSPLGVIGGALAGHAVATLLAVLGGSLLGTYLSEKTVAYIGGTLFLVFAAVTLIEIVT